MSFTDVICARAFAGKGHTARRVAGDCDRLRDPWLARACGTEPSSPWGHDAVGGGILKVSFT